MTAERPSDNDTMGRVIRLRPRRPVPVGSRRPESARIPASPVPVGDLSHYERAEDHDDYRHRMITNGLALAICVVLVLAGVWIADTMADLRKTQDCVLAGHAGCTPLDVPVRSRY
jgi:hypothetical protein